MVHAVMAAALGLSRSTDFLAPPPAIEVEGKNVLFIDRVDDHLMPPERPFADQKFVDAYMTTHARSHIIEPQDSPVPRRTVQRGSSRPSNLSKAARRMAKFASAMRI